MTKKRPGLWANIHAKRKRGEKMRKKGEKGAPTEAQMKSARGMNKGGQALKKVPEGNKGLPKLPKAIRNKMGYMNTGGIVKKAKHRGCGKVNPSRRKVTKYS